MRVALLDFDEAYLNALLHFLMKNTSNQFCSFSSVEDFLSPVLVERSSYDIGIIELGFYNQIIERLRSEDYMEFRTLDLDSIFKRVIILDPQGGECLEGVDTTIYKYGSMEELVKILEHKSIDVRSAKINNKTRGKNYLIYSPAHHELSEVFALSFCQMLSEKQSVLLVDLDSQSRLFSMMNREVNLSLVDCLYLMVNEENTNLEKYLQYYQDVAIFPTARSPEDMCDVSSEQWGMISNSVERMGFENIVYFINDINKGFTQIAARVDEIVLLNKKEEFYQDIQESFLNYLQVEKSFNNVCQITLPMSASNLTKQNFMLEELLVGNLGQYVRSVNYDI